MAAIFVNFLLWIRKGLNYFWNTDVVYDSLSCQRKSVHLLYDSQHKYAVSQKYHAYPFD